MIKHIVRIPLYNGYFIVLITNSVDEVNQIFPSFASDEELYGHATVDYYKDVEAFIVILNFDHHIPITHGVIAHEAFHLCNFLADMRGIKRDVNDEPLAYVIQWMVDTIYKFLDKHNLKIK